MFCEAGILRLSGDAQAILLRSPTRDLFASAALPVPPERPTHFARGDRWFESPSSARESVLRVTHALFADQSHSIPDNLVALLSHTRAWNYSAETAALLATFC